MIYVPKHVADQLAWERSKSRALWEAQKLDRERQLRCPKCGGTSIETTTMGCGGWAEDDVNRATCQNRDCRWTGCAGDWHAIDKLREAAKGPQKAN